MIDQLKDFRFELWKQHHDLAGTPESFKYYAAALLIEAAYELLLGNRTQVQHIVKELTGKTTLSTYLNEGQIT